MRRLLFLLAATAALCVPAVAAAKAPSPAKLAAQMCRTIRAQDGKATFKQTFHSFAGCLKQEKPDAKSDVSNAAKTCKAERSDPNFATSHDGKTFQEYYGTNSGNAKGAGKNAFGKCVSSLAKQNARSDAADTASAAKTCKAMRINDPSGFQSAYGTSRNALGKCVKQSKHS